MFLNKFTGMRKFFAGVALLALPMTGCDSEQEAEIEQEEGAYEPGLGGKADGASATSFNWPLLREGDLNRNVVAAQYLLRDHGHEISLTGLFDAKTRNATVAFQAANGLVDDGIIGNRTWEALVVTVRPGDTESWAVRAVQDLLKERFGYSISVTGEFGPTTDERVRAFQSDHCLSFVDAIVGPETWNALVADVSYCNGAGRLLDLHNQGEITLLNTDFGRNDGADPLANIIDAAAGRASNRSCNFPGGGRDSRLPCGEVQLDAQLIDAMISLNEDYGFGYIVTAISGARHSTNSFHYRGRAVDVGAIDGVTITHDTSKTRAMVNACAEMGAIEALGPHNEPKFHHNHIHCAF